MDLIDLSGAFHECPIPTLIMEGRWDLTWNTDKPGILNANHPNAELVMFEQAGHQPWADEPHRFLTVLQGFIEELTPVSDSAIATYRRHVADWQERLRGSAEYRLKSLDDSRDSYERIAETYTRDWLPELLASPDYFWHLQRVGFALYDVQDNHEAQYVFRQLREQAQSMDDRETIPLYVGLIWEGHMLDLLNRRMEAINSYRRAADMNLEGRWAHPQYGMDYQFTEYAEQRIAAPFRRLDHVGVQ